MAILAEREAKSAVCRSALRPVVRWAAKGPVSLRRLSGKNLSRAERVGAYVAVVWAAASVALPVAPPSAPLPALERVGRRVRGLPGIERLQRIDDVVITDDVPRCGSPQRRVGLD